MKRTPSLKHTLSGVFLLGVTLVSWSAAKPKSTSAPQDDLKQLRATVERLASDSSSLRQEYDARLKAQQTAFEKKLQDQASAFNAKLAEQASQTRPAPTVSSALLPPVGAIIAYRGDLASLPPNWRLCDGTNGTPDLRSKFIRGASDTNTNDRPGTQGGKDTTEGHYHQLDTDCRATNVSISNTEWLRESSGWAQSTEKASKFSDEYKVLIWRGVNPSVTHSHSGGSGNVTGTTKVSSPEDNRPRYYSVYFVMRIK